MRWSDPGAIEEASRVALRVLYDFYQKQGGLYLNSYAVARRIPLSEIYGSVHERDLVNVLKPCQNFVESATIFTSDTRQTVGYRINRNMISKIEEIIHSPSP